MGYDLQELTPSFSLLDARKKSTAEVEIHLAVLHKYYYLINCTTKETPLIYDKKQKQRAATRLGHCPFSEKRYFF